MKTLEKVIQTLVAIPSWAPQEQKAIEAMVGFLTSLHFSLEFVEISPGRKNILATRGKASAYPLFYAHIDTVKPVTPDEWHHYPLELTEHDGKWFGLGTYDMKGGIAAILEACEHTNAPIKFLCCVDEEEISEGAWSVLEQRKDFFSDVEIIISAEPNFDTGVFGITTARSGRCLFQTTIKGISAHIAKYKQGNDALLLALTPIEMLYAVRDEWYEKYGTVVQIRTINGESVGMSVMEHVTVVIEALIGIHDSIEAVQRRLEKIFPGDIAFKQRKTPFLGPYAFNDFPHKDRLGTIIKEETNQEMVLQHRASVGDDNVLATTGIPVITWGPDGGNAHAPNEYVLIESLETLSVMYRRFLNESYA